VFGAGRLRSTNVAYSRYTRSLRMSGQDSWIPCPAVRRRRVTRAAMMSWVLPDETAPNTGTRTSVTVAEPAGNGAVQVGQRARSFALRAARRTPVGRREPADKRPHRKPTRPRQ